MSYCFCDDIVVSVIAEVMKFGVSAKCYPPKNFNFTKIISNTFNNL